MAKITPTSYKNLEKFLKYIGCVRKRQKGSHIVYKRDGLKRPVIIPTYKNVPVFIIKNMLKVVKMSTIDYLQIMKDI